nr:Flp1 family type IVb pilin [Paenibacillus sp. MMS18-CY102]
MITNWTNNWNKRMAKLWKSEEGLGTLEIILIIAVIIIIALLFKDWIIELVNRLMGQADDQADQIFNS